MGSTLNDNKGSDWRQGDFESVAPRLWAGSVSLQQAGPAEGADRHWAIRLRTVLFHERYEQKMGCRGSEKAFCLQKWLTADAWGAVQARGSTVLLLQYALCVSSRWIRGLRIAVIFVFGSSWCDFSSVSGFLQFLGVPGLCYRPCGFPLLLASPKMPQDKLWVWY